MLQAPGESEAPGLFDYRSHLAHTRIHRHLATATPDDWRPVPSADPGPPLSDRFLPWAHATLARGLPDDPAARLVRGMLLGWRTALTEDVEEPFMRSGTLHVFAISGLHIALLTTTLVQMLRLLRLPRIACGLLSLPFLWFYLAATGWQPSAVRAGVMGTVVVGSWALSRPADLLNSLAAAALLILVPEPGQLFLAGFQLSFGVVAGLALIAPAIQDWLLARIAFDPLLPEDLRPRWQRWLAVPLRAATLNLATTLAAWLAALPLTLHHFHLLNPVSLIANLVVVPLSGLALVAGVLSLALGALLPPAAEWTNQSAWFWMQGMIAASEFCARVPGGSWYSAAPPWPWWVLYYGLLAALLAGWASIPRRRAWLAGAAGCASLAALAAFGWHTRSPRLTVLPECAGVLSQEPGWFGSTFLADAGAPGAARHLALPFARASGLDRLEDLLLSNATQRFAGGAPALLAALRPARLLIGDVRHRAASLRRAVETARSNRLPVIPVGKGFRSQGWEVMHPGPGDDS
ncbi:MAG: ComEC/Rec2 family competence protein, partial [Verrucomicrobiota bacterium]